MRRQMLYTSSATTSKHNSEKDRFMFTMIFTYLMALSFSLYAWFNECPADPLASLQLFVSSLVSTTLTASGILLIENMIEMMRINSRKIKYNLSLLCTMLPFVVIYVLYKENPHNIGLCVACIVLVLLTLFFVYKAFEEVCSNKMPDGNYSSINR